MFKFVFDTSNEAAAAEVRNKLLAYLEEETGHTRDLLPVEEIFSELVSNVLQHGDRWACIAIVWRDDGTCVLQVTDKGDGIDLSGWQPPPDMAEHGHGLIIVGGLCKDVSILAGPDGVGARVSAILPIHQRISVERPKDAT